MNQLPEYRAWHKAEKKMYRVVTLYLGAYEQSIALLDGAALQSPLMHCLPDEVKIMQYIGLKDKNGTKIFAGDIILTGDAEWRVAWHRHANGMFGWMVKDNKVHNWYVIDESVLRGKVIRNIYETSSKRAVA